MRRYRIFARRRQFFSRDGKPCCKLRQGLRADSGATGIEYGIIAGLLALTLVVGAQISGNGLNRMFQVIGAATIDATDSANDSINGN